MHSLPAAGPSVVTHVRVCGAQLQTKQLNGVVHEQRVLNQQLIGRNDELGQLYQRLKLQQSFLRKARSGWALCPGAGGD